MVEIVVRWLFSLAAACYIVASLTFLPSAIRHAHLHPAAEWAIYLLAELVVLGALVMLTLWWLVWQPGTEGKRFEPARFLGLNAIVLAPLFAVLVIPTGCFVFIPDGAGRIAGASVFAISIVTLLTASFYARNPRA